MVQPLRWIDFDALGHFAKTRYAQPYQLQHQSEVQLASPAQPRPISPKHWLLFHYFHLYFKHSFDWSLPWIHYLLHDSVNCPKFSGWQFWDWHLPFSGFHLISSGFFRWLFWSAAFDRKSGWAYRFHGHSACFCRWSLLVLEIRVQDVSLRNLWMILISAFWRSLFSELVRFGHRGRLLRCSHPANEYRSIQAKSHCQLECSSGHHFLHPNTFSAFSTPSPRPRWRCSPLLLYPPPSATSAAEHRHQISLSCWVWRLYSICRNCWFVSRSFDTNSSQSYVFWTFGLSFSVFTFSRLFAPVWRPVFGSFNLFYCIMTKSQTCGAAPPCRRIGEDCCYSAPKDSSPYGFARFAAVAAAARPQGTIAVHLWNRRDLDSAPSYRRSYFSGFCKCTIIHRCSGMTQWYHIHYFYFLPSCFGVGFRSTPVAWIGRPEAGWSCSAVVRRCRRCRVKGRGSTVCWIGRTRLRFLAISLDGCFGMGYGQCLNGLQMIRIRWKILFIILDFEFKPQNRAFTYLRF